MLSRSSHHGIEKSPGLIPFHNDPNKIKRRNQTSNLGVRGSNPFRRASNFMCGPETSVTDRTGHMGDNLVPNGLSEDCKSFLFSRFP
jgi:hypothetical protein